MAKITDWSVAAASVLISGFTLADVGESNFIGSMSGSWGTGALIGAGVGAAGGYLVDQHKKGDID